MHFKKLWLSALITREYQNKNKNINYCINDVFMIIFYVNYIFTKYLITFIFVLHLQLRHLFQ